MKAVVWHGVHDVRVERVKDPEIVNPRDAVLRVTATAICGSDLHLYNGMLPTMKPGDILGHEFMGVVEAVGPSVTNVRPGDRVLVPFNIACGNCGPCMREQWSLCDNSNPNAGLAERLYGYSCSGLFGYSHLFGGYSGGQAEFVRVPFADVGLFAVPDNLADDQALYLTDVFPTGYMAAENCDIKRGDVVAVWGCGPIGQFAIRSAFLLGAEDVIAIDRIPERLAMANSAGARSLNVDEVNVLEALFEMTAGRGPDASIDCVGLEAHGRTPDAVIDKAKQSVRLELDRPHVLRLAIQAAGKGSTVSIPGVYGGFIDKMPMGTVFEKALQLRTGQTHTHRYVRPLMERIRRGEIDPSFVVTHRGSLDDAPAYYKLMAKHEDAFVKSFLVPDAVTAGSESLESSEELSIYQM
ncbi:MAG TPA: zinc-dependent alcohol dehydrogenase [Candidatus Baltobacteraceae bacterium]|jgi:threonine dehydrogenase-like Zn-dependent dehydrogenase|nr:zinc-dependent alcohol dehydrogenase [Candidatus Baltobacteraceae bacterium]